MFKKIARWIMDTGSGVDLASKNVSHASQNIERAGRPADFATANGITKATHVCRASMPALSEEIIQYWMIPRQCYLLG